MKITPQQILCPSEPNATPGSLPVGNVQQPQPAIPSQPIPNINIDRLIIESSSHINTTTLRDGFAEVWRDANSTSWNQDTAAAFSKELNLNLSKGMTGRDLGRQLAHAILNQAHQATPT